MGVFILIILLVVAGLIIKYKFNSGMERDNAKNRAIISQINAAKNGDVEAMYWLGTYYHEERSKLNDLSSKRADDLKNHSIHWFMQAIERGDADSMIFLAYQYSRGSNTDQSGETLYTDNSGFGYDPEKELALIRMAAKAGDARGQCQLAFKMKDDRDKLYWLEQSASQGHSRAYEELGFFYGNRSNIMSGQKREREDLGKAEYYFYLAMQSNNESICSNAAYELGCIFGCSYFLYFGNYVPNSYEDPERAIYWFYQASLWGNGLAQSNIDTILQNTGITISEAQYRQWRSDFENNHYLTDKQYIPQGTKYQIQLKPKD